MKNFSLKYTLLTYRLDQLWFPLAFWALFAIIILLVGRPDQNLEIVRGYMGVAVPLIAGVMAAYAILDDPALELRFATPVRMMQILLERSVFVFLIQAVCVLLFLLLAKIIQIDFSPLGTWAEIHFSWIIPTIAFMALGTFGSILGAQTMMGAFLVGLVWIIQIIIRDGMAINNWKYFYIFMSILSPEHPDLFKNQMALLALSAFFLFLAWILLHRQERYI